METTLQIIAISIGSRISQDAVRQCVIWQKCSLKLHENKRNWIQMVPCGSANSCSEKFTIVNPFFPEQVSNLYNSYPGKRLTNVIKTVMTSSKQESGVRCSMTDGCLAVNIIGNYDIICELKSGFSNENEMKDDSTSELLVASKIFCFPLGKWTFIITITF